MVQYAWFDDRHLGSLPPCRMNHSLDSKPKEYEEHI